MRLHICWGNYEGPHTHDIPLATVFDVAVKARPQALLFEAANPRHAHEWEELAAKKIPDDTILIPGCIDSTTNFVEHPKLVAQRIENYAKLVGRERVVAGTDCGFATFAAQQKLVVPSIAWAKLAALAEVARIASDRFVELNWNASRVSATHAGTGRPRSKRPTGGEGKTPQSPDARTLHLSR